MQILVFLKSNGCSEQDGPYWLTCEERLASWDDKFLEPFVDKQKSASKLRKDLIDAGVSIGRGKARMDLQRLAQENEIPLTPLVDMQVNCTKTCLELVTNIQAPHFILQRRKYNLKELQELATSCNLDIRVIKRKRFEGWARKPKGLC
jgi:hypothetical protein